MFTVTWDSWIEALESNKYERGEGGLRQKDKFCCLGVACDVNDPKLWTWGVYKVNGDERGGWLPKSLREHLGLTHAEERMLGSMNDNGSTFPQIAAKLREIRGNR